MQLENGGVMCLQQQSIYLKQQQQQPESGQWNNWFTFTQIYMHVTKRLVIGVMPLNTIIISGNRESTTSH